MTRWEYGQIYVVHTVGPSPAVCVVLDRSGHRVLQHCHGLVRAANVLGAAGWLVDGQGERAACTQAVNDLVSDIEGAVGGDWMMCYFMRRPAEAEPPEARPDEGHAPQ
jgi:hypothetical protein